MQLNIVDASGIFNHMIEYQPLLDHVFHALSDPTRRAMLGALAAGERSVGELEALLHQRQATVSQQLARLREDGLVTSRANGKARLYRIADPRAARVVELLYETFCGN